MCVRRVLGQGEYAWFQAELVPRTENGTSCDGLLVSGVVIGVKDAGDAADAKVNVGGTFAEAELCAVVGPAASSASVSLTCGRPLEGRLVGVRLWRKAWKKSCRLRRPCRGKDLVVWYSKEKHIFISMQ